MSLSKNVHGRLDAKMVFGFLTCVLMTANYRIETIGKQPRKLVPLNVFQRKRDVQNEKGL